MHSQFSDVSVAGWLWALKKRLCVRICPLLFVTALDSQLATASNELNGHRQKERQKEAESMANKQPVKQS
jgi:hypothetical protein